MSCAKSCLPSCCCCCCCGGDGNAEKPNEKTSLEQEREMAQKRRDARANMAHHLQQLEQWKRRLDDLDDLDDLDTLGAASSLSSDAARPTQPARPPQPRAQKRAAHVVGVGSRRSLVLENEDLSADTSTDAGAWSIPLDAGTGTGTGTGTDTPAGAASSPSSSSPCAWASTLDGRLCAATTLRGERFCLRHLCRSAGCSTGVATDQDSCASCTAKYA